MTEPSLLNTLVEVDDCLLALIDIQRPFLDKLTPAQAGLITGRANWLLVIAQKLHVPSLATAEDITRHGLTDPSVFQGASADIAVYNKMVFDITGNPEIMEAVESSGRRTVVLAGLETDVCIAQSAIGLQQAGYRVAVLEDVTCSPGAGHAAGLERVRGAGILVTSLKGLYYEWVRTVELSDILADYINDGFGPPPGVIL